MPGLKAAAKMPNVLQTWHQWPQKPASRSIAAQQTQPKCHTHPCSSHAAVQPAMHAEAASQQFSALTCRCCAARQSGKGGDPAAPPAPLQGGWRASGLGMLQGRPVAGTTKPVVYQPSTGTAPPCPGVGSPGRPESAAQRIILIPASSPPHLCPAPCPAAFPPSQ